MFSTILDKVAAAISAVAIAISAAFAPVPLSEGEPQVGAQLPQVVAVFETSLAAPITAAATTMTLVSNSVRGGGSLSGYNCFTIDEGSAQAEFVCGTVSGTSVTGMTRGISPSTGTSTVAALQFSHRRGASVKITDFPIIQILKAQQSGEDTFDNPIRYISTLSTSTIGQNSSNIANVAYVNSIAFNGASVIDATTGSRGISELATGGEIAASTATGTSGVLVIPASLATSTYNAGTAANRVVVTGTNGTIDDDFLPRTIATTTTFTSTTTFTGPIVTTFGSTTVRTYTSDGSWSVPANLRFAIIEIQGAGGGGAGSNDSGPMSLGGGGGGGYSKSIFGTSTFSGTSTVGIVVGSGGAGGANTDANGSSGGSSHFGSFAYSSGGTGGEWSGSRAGGSGGTGFGNVLNITGQAGGYGITNFYTGHGGRSFLGSGGIVLLDGSSAGSGYGGGGSGASISGTTDIGGAAGSNGVVIVHEYF